MPMTVYESEKEKQNVNQSQNTISILLDVTMLNRGFGDSVCAIKDPNPCFWNGIRLE